MQINVNHTDSTKCSLYPIDALVFMPTLNCYIIVTPSKQTCIRTQFVTQSYLRYNIETRTTLVFKRHKKDADNLLAASVSCNNKIYFLLFNI